MDELVYVVSLVAQCFFTIEVIVKMVGEGYHPERSHHMIIPEPQQS